MGAHQSSGKTVLLLVLNIQHIKVNQPTLKNTVAVATQGCPYAICAFP